jgi:hypothetical protein
VITNSVIIRELVGTGIEAAITIRRRKTQELHDPQTVAIEFHKDGTGPGVLNPMGRDSQGVYSYVWSSSGAEPGTWWLTIRATGGGVDLVVQETFELRLPK